MVVELDRLILSGNAAFGSVVAAALTAAWNVPAAGYLIPQIQGMVMEGRLRGGSTINGSARGLHYLVSTGSREDSDQIDFRVDSIEVVFDATYANYLAFLDEILAMLYAGSLNPWREALTSVSGTSKLFSNAFTRKRGLEPVSIIREVTAMRKAPKDTISHLCNEDAPWSPVTVRQAIRDIGAGTARYFARFEDTLVEIRVVDGRYLRTVADATEQNNLDNLPCC